MKICGSLVSFRVCGTFLSAAGKNAASSNRKTNPPGRSRRRPGEHSGGMEPLRLSPTLILLRRSCREYGE